MGIGLRGWGALVLAVSASGCLLGGGDRRGSGPSPYADPDAGVMIGTDVGTAVDPRPPAERACPTGGVLSVRLWQVYATPLQPDGSVWDGLSSGTRELVCRVTGRALRAAVRYGLDEWAPGTGGTFDRYAGSTFQRIVSEQCGVGANWLQERYEGPDMFALGSVEGASAFQTSAEQDTWQAPRAAGSSWSTAVWRVPCGDVSTTVTYEVKDEDIAFDDAVEGATFRPGEIPPQVLCSGWGWLDGRDGLVGALFRLDVSQAEQACTGLFANSFREMVIPSTPLVQRSPAAPTQRSTGGP